MNKLHTLILMCLLSLVGISANAQEFHPCDANHDGTVDVADIAITANYILTGEYQPDDPVTPVDPVVPDTTGNAVTTSIATNITSVSATLNAVVNIPQGVSIFVVSMIYSTDENPSETTGTVLDKRVEVDANTATEYAFDIAGLDIGTTYYYRAKLLTYPDRKTYYGDVMSFTTNDVNGKPGDMVDLGLPSGTMWAKCNLGAASAEQLGDLYAWGETTTKESFSLDNYYYYFFGEYVNIGSDIRGTLYDAATASWKGAWHMPSTADFAELKNNCNWTWTTYEGVQGYVIKGKNGNSIFLPKNEAGFWSGKGYSTSQAYYMKCSSSSVSTNSTAYRYTGKYIRPVQCPVQSVTLSADSTKIKIGKTFQLTVTVTPPHAIQTVAWTSSDQSVATVSESGLVKGVGTGSAVITATTAEGGLTATCNVEVFEPDYNGHEFVDLGLSVEWATCNVGASSPEDYGDYFAWGETEPKDYYDWSTYKWCNGSDNTLTKYCTDSYYGTVDNKTVLDLEDDAAHVNWGGDWRMPTLAEQEELINNCTWEWKTQNGVKGRKATSKINGNSIFLPAAGYRDGSSLYSVGSRGNYWSSSLYSSYSGSAYFLYFSSDYVDWGGSGHGYGQSVRAVCP